MNKTEQRYADQLEIEKLSGNILDWRFEPMNLRIAPRTYYRIDFMVVHRNCIEMVEIKGGHIRDDALVKFKATAALFPWFKWSMIQWKNKTVGWKSILVI